ncbi:hypothetical protein D0866_02911, partial [Hortaea werneckii]
VTKAGPAGLIEETACRVSIGKATKKVSSLRHARAESVVADCIESHEKTLASIANRMDDINERLQRLERAQSRKRFGAANHLGH